MCGVDPQDLRSIYVFFKKNIEPWSYFIYSYNYGDQKFYPDGDVLNAKSTEVLNWDFGPVTETWDWGTDL